MGDGCLSTDRDFPKARHRVAPPFEDGRLGRHDLRRLGVVDPDFLAVEDLNVPGVADLARASKRVERDVRHHVERACRFV